MSVPVFVCNTHTTGSVLRSRYTNVKGVLRLAKHLGNGCARRRT